MILERRRIASGSKLRAETSPDGVGRVISGYCAVFNSPSVLICEPPLGRFVEVILPGAFTETLKIADVRALWNHNDDHPLGRSGRNLTLTEDETGLHFVCQLPDTQAARDLVALVEDEIIDGCSFGFTAEADHIEDGYDGIPVRYLDRVSLVEVTLGTAWPAYEASTIVARSIAERAGRPHREIPSPGSTPRLDRARRIITLYDI